MANEYLLAVGDLLASIARFIVSVCFTSFRGVYWFGILMILVLFGLFLNTFHKD